MKLRRQRQCPAWSCFAVDIQCQRLLKHDGPHGASPNPRYAQHYSWTDADPNAIEVLPGNVWFHRPDPSRVLQTARRVGEWAALVPGAFFLWWACSLTTAAVFLAVDLLLSVRRAHFVDLGRFTAGVWPGSPAAPRLIFAVAWMWHGPERNVKRAGLEVVLGRVTVGVYALAPRKEWGERKRQRAALHVRRKAGRL
ncbi:hypothetical protein ACWD7T_34405 [Streptomyces sp. 900116325]